MTSQVTLTEYTPELAEKLAIMWNESGSNWGGNNAVRTAEAIREEEATSRSLNVFLAMADDKVVGYCSFAQYEYDAKTMYIPLLNVSPEYHGKKIGKMLVLQCVRKAIELNQGRLDLFTWSGNTKAVPLYKKCGFFWEKHDDGVHLMNFMPVILNTPLLKPFFEEFDWYADSVRPIAIEPDGREEGEFHYFEHHWKKSGRELKIEFERRGRGLTLLECDDYRIRAKLAERKLVCDNTYAVEYEVINKSGKELNLSIKGQSSDVIQNDYGFEGSVKDRICLQGDFYIRQVKDDKEKMMQATEGVSAVISVNGMDAEFRVGLMPKLPCEVKVDALNLDFYQDQQKDFYLEITNNYPVKAEFRFVLPESDLVDFLGDHPSVVLEAGQRTTTAVQAIIRDFGFYSGDLEITATPAEGKITTYKKTIGLPITQSGIRYGGESNGRFVAGSGNNMIGLDIQNYPNEFVSIMNGRWGGYEGYYPQLGAPFSSEYSLKHPDSMEWIDEGATALLKLTYTSGDFPGITLIGKFRVYEDGLIQWWYEVENKSETVFNDLQLNMFLYVERTKMVLPAKDGILELNDSFGANMNLWDWENLQEPWVYFRPEEKNNGLSWDSGLSIRSDEWRFAFLAKVGDLEPGHRHICGKVSISTNRFDDWRQFRRWVMKSDETERIVSEDTFQWIVNDGNPFVEGAFDSRFLYRHNAEEKGILGMISSRESLEIPVESDQKEIVFNHQSFKSGETEKMTLDMDLELFQTSKTALVFPKGGEDIRLERTKESGLDVLSVHNGFFTMSMAPEYSFAPYSLKAEGREWLDTLFPKAGPKGWDNPWCGGMFSRFENGPASRLIMENEEWSCDFAEVTDSKGNLWKGLKVTVKVNKHLKAKGLEWDQYYVMLPGVPVIAAFAHVRQNSGQLLIGGNSFFHFYLKGDEELKKRWLEVSDCESDVKRIKAGCAMIDLSGKESVKLGCTADSCLYGWSYGAKVNGYVDKDMINATVYSTLDMKPGTEKTLEPVFLIHSDKADLKNSDFSVLKQIRFSV